MTESPITLKADLSTDEWLALVDQPDNEVGVRLACQVVRIRDTRLPDGSWFLRLPELIVPVNGQRGEVEYQQVDNWTGDDSQWSYPETKLSANGNYAGTIASKIRAEADSVFFEIAVTNRGHRPWRNTLAWLCFNHHAAKAYYRAETFIFGKGRWVKTALTAEHCTFAIGDCDLPWWTRSEQRASLGVIATRVHHESGPLVIAIASRTAVLLGQTSAWPCTDIGIGFGDPRPGETVVRAGRIYFLQGDLDDLRERIRTDFEM